MNFSCGRFFGNVALKPRPSVAQFSVLRTFVVYSWRFRVRQFSDNGVIRSALLVCVACLLAANYIQCDLHCGPLLQVCRGSFGCSLATVTSRTPFALRLRK
jgi:hypothetical protein